MYCKSCGKKLSADAKFCRECGTKVEGETKVNKEKSNTVLINKGKATASLVLGIISLFLGLFFIPLPIVGLILGICQKEKCGEKIASIILNSISLFFIVLFWGAIIFLIFLGTNIKNYESIEDNRGNSDIIINDDYVDTFNMESIFE